MNYSHSGAGTSSVRRTKVLTTVIIAKTKWLEVRQHSNCQCLHLIGSSVQVTLLFHKSMGSNCAPHAKTVSAW